MLAELRREYHLFLQERLEDLLDLGYFACRKGNVSFAAVNAYGRSNFSALSEVCIRGG